MSDEVASLSGAADAAASDPNETGASTSRTLDDIYSLLVEIRDSGTTDSVAGLSEGLTVSLDPAQYDRFSAIGGAGLQADVLSIGVCALILGAVIATAMTVHWRGSRG